MTNGSSHCYHLDASTFNFGGFRGDFSFLFHFSRKFLPANRIAPDVTPRSAASHLGAILFAYVHKKDARLIWVNNNPRFPSLLQYVRCKYGVAFVRRCFRDVGTGSLVETLKYMLPLKRMIISDV